MKRYLTRSALAMGAAGIVVGALGLGAVTGLAGASDSTPSSAAAGSSESVAATGRGPGEGLRVGRLGGRVVHGEFVVRGKDGRFVTLADQRGTVTSRGGSSIVVKSADGTSWTWATNADTTVRGRGSTLALTDVAVGTTVRVLGPVSGTTRTARFVGVRPAQPAQGNGTSGGSAA